jgi:hypothetical protein
MAYLEHARRERLEQVIFLIAIIKPPHSVPAAQHGHLTIMKRRDIRIRLCGQNRMGFRPVARYGPPYPREIEPVAIGERKAVVFAVAAKPKLGGRYEAAVTRKCPAFHANDSERPAAALAWPQTPRQFHHLNIAAGTPYDDATFFKRRVGIESLYGHHERTYQEHHRDAKGGPNGGTMCNDYRLRMDISSIIEEFADLKIKIRFSEGRPNIDAHCRGVRSGVTA